MLLRTRRLSMPLLLTIAMGCDRDEAPPPTAPVAASSTSAEPASASAEPASTLEDADVLDAALPSTVALEARSRGGGPVVLARAGGRDLALVGDRDREALVVVDAGSLEAERHIDLGGRPEQLVVAKGRAFAVLRDANRLVALASDGDRWARTASVATPAEPVAIAARGDEIYVVAAWDRRLTAYDADTLAERWSLPLARAPRGVAVSPDGDRLHVAHAVGGTTTEVRLAGDPEVRTRSFVGTDATSGLGRGHRRPIRGMCGTAMMRMMRNSTIPRGGSQGFAVVATDDEAIFPAVLVHTRTGDSGGAYGSGGTFPGQEPVLASVRPKDDHVTLRVANDSFSTERARSGFSGGHRRDGCFLPRHAAFDPVSDTILVACVGSGQVVAHRRGDRALSLSTPARWAVPDGPVGVAVHDAGRAAYVWSQFAGELSRVDLTDLKPGAPSRRVHWPELDHEVQHARLHTEVEGRPRLSAAAEQGRRLFHATGDARLSADGRSCASCHPDGREDGLTWPTPNGPRQTPMLAGRLGPETAPYGWDGDASSVAEHLRETFRRLGGQGLDGAELDALLAYLGEMSTPVRSEPADSKLVERGRALFHDDANVGCAVCHVGGTGSNGARHDVGGGVEVETPSLRFVADTGPYFHDGRYATLSDVLAQSAGTMGWAHDMKPEDRRSLEAYLRTL